MLEVGGYMAIALMAVQVILVFSLVRKKTTIGMFTIVSPVRAYARASGAPKCCVQNENVG
jgi:hypothetical protein